MSKKSLENLFAPASIAIVGASNKKGKVGTVITDNILKLGYRGQVYLVNPSYKLLKLKKCYSSLSLIEKDVDVAIIAVPAKFVVGVIRESARKIKNFVVISAGFSEIGQEGEKLEKELQELSNTHGLNILGPNCLGFIVPGLKLNASFAGGMPEVGNIAFISQSGALAVALMDKAKQENLSFSNIVSVGNKMQLAESELLEYFANDNQTKVIGMYLEGIKDGQKFIETARRVSRIKPVVILKAGKTEKAQLAISSHTGALAGSDEIMDIAFEKSGIIRADDLEEFFDLLMFISFVDAPKNNKVSVITNAGGAGVLTTDAFKDKEVVLADFSKKIKEEIKKSLPPESSVENPIDLLGDAAADRYKAALDVLRDKNIGTHICVLTPQQQTPVEKITETIIENKKNSANVLMTIFIGGDRIRKSLADLKENFIPNFGNPDSAVRVLDKYYKWNVFKKNKQKSEKPGINIVRKKEVSSIIAGAFEEKRSALYFSEAAIVMKKYGITPVESLELLPGKNISETGQYPVVLKVDSDKVLHKSDKQALVLNIKNFSELEVAVQRLQKDFPMERLIIQPMNGKFAELILGIKRDEIFGPVIVYGLGGIYTEVFKMVNFMIPPMSKERIKTEILQSKISFLFQGVRSQKSADIDEFVNIVHGLMDFALENEDVREFDINPLFINTDGQKSVAVDIKIIL
ncbi:MAG: putative acyl-CoA synthetase [Candidatus Moranbacteria bacterium GW2011_GWE1_36_7]|nr:MAG: putative acyl-CoA synthetase [Candidatus Moranbacteria bacterium GW2011_GWD2_36_12]KKQ06652.1 MAG: putative acyl-CoA synthetase [Candidatus Moranbacteria bacterium GW2011_GWE2_36_40]KKQ15200.1 MAG: putative acyl-CoA synthetase [Candidatus Moranbacteria bacterium GW2011_GWE1_36_7]